MPTVPIKQEHRVQIRDLLNNCISNIQQCEDVLVFNSCADSPILHQLMLSEKHVQRTYQYVRSMQDMVVAEEPPVVEVVAVKIKEPELDEILLSISLQLKKSTAQNEFIGTLYGLLLVYADRLSHMTGAEFASAVGIKASYATAFEHIVRYQAKWLADNGIVIRGTVPLVVQSDNVVNATKTVLTNLKPTKTRKSKKATG